MEPCYFTPWLCYLPIFLDKCCKDRIIFSTDNCQIRYATVSTFAFGKKPQLSGILKVYPLLFELVFIIANTDR
jgi:hypothetical protein